MTLSNIKGVNSIRAFGLACVVLYHYFPSVLPAGFLGVDAFFVISGFLVTARFVREYELSGDIDFPAFLSRRVKKLLPPAAFMVAVALALALFVSPDLRAGIRPQAAAVFGWTTNYYEIATGSSYEGGLLPHLFVHTWTLGVEMQYYLIWGIVASTVFFLWGRSKQLTWAHIGRSSRRTLALVAIALTPYAYYLMRALAYGESDPSAAYYATTAHGYPLLLGSALGAVLGMKVPKRVPRAGICAVGITCAAAGFLVLARVLAFTDYRTYKWGILAAAALTMLCLYLLVCIQKPQKGRPREIKIVSYIGKRSYSIYLFHWCIYHICEQFANDIGFFHRGFVAIVALILSLLFAEVSYRLFEQSGGFKALSRLRRGVAVGLVVAAAGAACVSLVLAPAKTQIEADYQHQQELQSIRKMDEYGTYFASLVLDPVALHGKEDELPETPSERAAREAAETDPENADYRESEGAPVSPILPPSEAKITLIGDSVMLGAAEALERTLGSAQVDAVESRNMSEGPRLIAEYAERGELGEYVVVALATNVQNFTVDAAYWVPAVLPKGHKLIFVTPYGKDYMEDTAEFIRFLCTQYEYTTVADWNLAIKDHRELLAPDGMHMRTDDSRQIYANCIAQAIKVAEGKPAKKEEAKPIDG